MNNSIEMNQYIDDILESSLATQHKYNEWKQQYAAARMRAGLHMPVGIEFKQAWNREQSRRSKELRIKKRIDYYKRELQQAVKDMQLVAITEDWKQDLVNLSGLFKEEEELDFDAIDATLLKLQEQRDSAAAQIKAQTDNTILSERALPVEWQDPDEL